eukprot:TRINITY_DN78288_c0_g1_i1.p1 TRINITY_DN78288_c0_g1~~TRINITY_DN78288_c0_g1_i1.p1  ORF type:complete len:487 (-),score=96.53 TRINITY_DN78288_c0_g1_i1:77-1537(-)
MRGPLHLPVRNVKQQGRRSSSLHVAASLAGLQLHQAFSPRLLTSLPVARSPWEGVPGLCSRGQTLPWPGVTRLGRRLRARATSSVADFDAQDLGAFVSTEGWLTGKVKHQTSYGVWVAIAPPAGHGQEAAGLLHLSELSQDTLPEPGQTIKVRVTSVDTERGQLCLSCSPPTPSSSSTSPLRGKVSDLSAFESIFACEWLPGHVSGEGVAAAEGVLVDVTPPSGGQPVRGIVPAHRIDNFAALAFRAGQQVHVRVLGIVDGMLELSMKGGGEDIKADLEAQLRALQASEAISIDAAAWLAGTVAEVHPYGLLVNLPGGRGRGVLYATELERYLEDPSEHYVVGQEVQVRITDESEAGLLGLSMRREPAAVQADVDAQQRLEQVREAHLGVEADEDAADEPLDLELRAMRQGLKAFLSISPSRPLRGFVQGDTPFGVLVSITHPDNGGPPVRGLLAEGQGAQTRSGDEIEVRLVTVDLHRGVLALTM